MSFRVIQGGADPVGNALRATNGMHRAQALTVTCRYCHADIGRECYDPRNGVVLVKQPAHFMRLQDVGL